jgi:hypothetical protein
MKRTVGYRLQAAGVAFAIASRMKQCSLCTNFDMYRSIRLFD